MKKMKKNSLKDILNNKDLLIKIIAVFIVLLVILILFLLVSNRKVVCTLESDQSANGYKLNTKYIIKYRGDYVKKITINETIESSKKKLLSQFKKDFERQYSNNQKIYGGVKYKVISTDDKVTTKVKINYKKFDMKKFIENNESMEQYTNNNKLTISGAKKMYESAGANCK